jgi:hypothetical protein
MYCVETKNIVILSVVTATDLKEGNLLEKGRYFACNNIYVL